LSTKFIGTDIDEDNQNRILKKPNVLDASIGFARIFEVTVK